MTKNKLLFPVSTAIYNIFSPQTPTQTWEDFDGGKALAIVPNPADFSSDLGTDIMGNTTISAYTPRDRPLTYTVDLKYNLWAYYKILQAIQDEANTGVAQQVRVIDYINPDWGDLGIGGDEYTERWGVITQLQTTGATRWEYTGSFIGGSQKFLKLLRCQGTRFVFEERGVPIQLTITAPGGSFSIFPLRDEVNIADSGKVDLKDGFTATHAMVTRQKHTVTVNSKLNDRSHIDTLKTLYASCVSNNVFTAASLTYGDFAIQGAISEIRQLQGEYTQYNKTTMLQDSTNGGFTFKFIEL